MATLTVYPDPSTGSVTCDSWVGRYPGAADENWATIRVGAGTNANATVATSDIVNWYGKLGSTGNWYNLQRAIFTFDTSALGADATISSVVLSLYGSNKFDQIPNAPDIDIYTATPADPATIAAADFSQIGSTSQTGSPITYADWSTVGYNDFTFNATGIGNISKTGISKFGVRNANYDVAGIAPDWGNDIGCALSSYMADQTGTTNDPKLVITYKAGGAGNALFFGVNI